MLGPKWFCVRNSFGSKQNLDQKINWGRKKMLCKKNFNFWSVVVVCFLKRANSGSLDLKGANIRTLWHTLVSLEFVCADIFAKMFNRLIIFPFYPILLTRINNIEAAHFINIIYEYYRFHHFKPGTKYVQSFRQLALQI